MEVTALHITQLTNVLFLLCALDHKVDSVFLRVNPNRLQFFEYDAVTFHCEGLNNSTAWKVVHKFKGELSSCKTTSKVFSCNIKNVYIDESGEYWCEAGGGKTSTTTITVTSGSVILESPSLPVMEGDDVTLRCRNKTTSSILTADFYKDGVLILSSSAGNMTIHSVSRSDEGLYKCIISGAGESAESRLVVRVPEDHKGTTSSNPTSSNSTPWIIITLSLVVLLLMVGLLHLGKGYWQRVLLCLSTLTPGSVLAEDQTVSIEASAAVANKATYAVVTKNRKKKDEGQLSSGAVYYTLDPDDTQELEPGVSSITAISVPSAGTNLPLRQDDFYSIIQEVAE